jgi:hypothetical protein
LVWPLRHRHIRKKFAIYFALFHPAFRLER